jgi:DNA replication protein DnaC
MTESLDLYSLWRDLGFSCSRAQLDALVQHAIAQRFAPSQVLEDLARMERRERDARNLERRTKAAKLGTVKPLEQFDWNHPRKIPRALVEELLALDFISAGQNVLFRGPSGVGKTTLAKHLGFEALRRGYSVRFSTFAQCLADLVKQESLPALERRMKRYTSPELLILDEIGYLPCDTGAADLLFNIITRRHESRSVVITTNLPFKQWGNLFAGAACVAALIDRFAQHCHTIDIVADSWRQKHSLSRSSTKAARASRRTSSKGRTRPAESD